MAGRATYLLMFAMSCIVIVPEGSRDVVFHWGRLDTSRGELTPGLHFKWPWPADTTKRFEVDRIHEVWLGAGEKRTRQQREAEFIKGREVHMWTEEHGERVELDFLIAKVRGEGAPEELAPAQIIKLVAVVYYRIGQEPGDVIKYGLKYAEPQKLLEHVAQQEMTRYCATATLDKSAGDKDTGRPEAIMTTGRVRAAKELKRRIQKAVGPEGLDMGVGILDVQFTAIHPPKEVAPAYEAVLAEERRREAVRYQAEAVANKYLTAVAGDPINALKLALSIRVLEELGDLKELHKDRVDFTRQIEQFIAMARNELKNLDEEIVWEKLLGKILEGEAAPTVVLRGEYAAHLASLEGLLADVKAGKAIDFAVLIADAGKVADERFKYVLGEPAKLVAEAASDRIAKELAERGLVRAFVQELPAYNACPQIYMLDRYLDVWDKVLPRTTKYVLLADRDGIEIRLNWERQAGEVSGVIQEPQGGGQ